VHALAELEELAIAYEQHGATLRLLVDHPEQVKALAATARPWSIFVKVDGGARYAQRYTISSRAEGILAAALVRSRPPRRCASSLQPC